MSIQRPLSITEQPLGFWTCWILPPKTSIMNRVILKAFPTVHALIQSSGNRKADPSQYTTNLDFYGIMHNLLIYFYSDRVVSEPSSAVMWGRRKGLVLNSWNNHWHFYFFPFSSEVKTHISKLLTLEQKDGILGLLAHFGKNQPLSFKNVLFAPVPFTSYCLFTENCFSSFLLTWFTTFNQKIKKEKLNYVGEVDSMAYHH